MATLIFEIGKAIDPNDATATDNNVLPNEDLIYPIANVLAVGEIGQLGNVNLTGNSPSLANNHFLVYNGTSWVHEQPSDALISLGVTSTSTELNKLDGATVSTAQINYLDITALGISQASKVITVDANGDLIVPDSDKFQFGEGLDMTLYHDGTNSYITNQTGALKIATETSGIAVQIGHSTSEVTIGDNLVVSGNLTVNGQTTTVNSTVTTIDDPIITLGGDTAPGSDDNKDRGIEFRYHNGSVAKVGFFGYDDSTSKFTFIPDATNNSEVFSGSAGNVAFGAGEFSGDLTIDTYVLKVDSTNNRVGIGTASPSKVLHVVDTAADSEIARFQGADGNLGIINGSKITFSRSANNYLTCTDTNGALVFETGGGGNNRLTIDSSGDSIFSGHVTLDNAKTLRLSETDANGSHYVALKAPDSVTTNTILTLPDGAGTNGQALTTNGSGTLSWSTISTSLASASITGQTAITSIADDDLVLVADASDSNNLKKITKANFVSGLGGSTTLAGLTDTTISGPSSGQILVYDGSNSFDNVSISGDATLSAAGALTIAANAVEGSMLNNNVISGQTEMTGDVEDADELLISDAGTVKRADFSVVRDAVFADITGDALIAAGGSLTIQSGSVEGSMLHDNVISQKTELAAGLASTDELLVSDAGSLKRMDVSVLQGYLQSNLTFATALTQENVEDYVGGMVSGNTETFISVSYDDSDGTLDFVVPVKDEDNMTSDSATHLATQQSIKAYVDSKTAASGLDISGFSGEITTLAQDDFLVASDTSGGDEKKITFSNLEDSIFANISGDATIAAGGALTIAATSVENSMLAGSIANAKLANSAVVIGSTSTALGATSTALAGLTQLDVDNIRVNGNTISSTDANGNMILSPNGTGKVIVDGDGTTSNGGVSIENGLIDLKNGGSVSKIKFYCESSNAHAQTLQGAPHSASASNTLVLPAAAGTLVGTGDSGTVSNTMLAGSITAAKLNNAIFADLEALGAPASDGQFIVATGSGAFAYESANTARTSLGLGTGSSPTFTSLTLSAQATAIAMNSQKITGLATPTADGDAATKAYVDSVAEGLDVKDSVHVASTANIASLLDGCDAGATIDGVVLVAGDRVLLKDQSTASENGIYIVAADGVAPARAADMAASSSAAGVFVFVEEGTANADAGFVCTSNSGADTVGTHSLAFTQFSGAGQVTAGDGLAKSGNSLSVNVDDSSIETNSDSLRVKAGGITNAMLADDAVGADELAANAVVNASVVDGAIKADKLDIDGSTDIGADLVDADLIVVDDGAGGTNRKSALSRIKKYIYSAMTGDATSSDAGVLTLAASSVEGSMLNDDVISGQTAMTGDVADADELLISDNGTVKRADFSVVRDAVFNDVSGDATIAAGGALTLAASSVEGSMLNASAITGQTAETSIADDDLIIISDTSASGALRKMTKANFVSGLGSGSFASSDITGQTAITSSQSSDIIVLADASDSNNLKKITKDNFLSLQAHTSHSSVSIGDFTFDQSGGSTTQYLRLKMNADENANEPIFLVENQSSSTYGPIIALGVREENSNAIGNGDILGQIRFQETEDNGGITKWASIHGIAQDHSNEYGQIDLKVNSGGTEAVALRLGTASGGTFVDVQNHDGSDSGLKLNGTLVTSTASELNKLDGATVTTAEINLLDGGTSVGSSITIADADGFIINDAGTMKTIPASDLKTYIGAGAADDLTAGDAAVTLTTTSGNITIDAQANDSDIIFAGTDNSSHITMLTLDGSDAGTAIFNHDIKMQNDGAVLSLGTNGDVSLTHVHDAGLTLNSTRYLSFNDTGTKVWSSEDGQLDLASDGTMVDSVLVNAASGGVKLNAGLDGNAAAIHLDSASGVTIAGGDNNDSVYVENSPLELEQISAPSTTTNKLYNVGGTLTWNGSAVGGGGGSATIPLVTVVTGNTTAAFASSGSNGDNERIYLVNNGSTAVTITLPALSGLSGKKFQIKMLGTANVTIDTNGSEAIEGTANGTFVLSTQYEAVTCVANATGTVNGWYII